MTSEERRQWLKDRQGGIGGTDIASITGLGFHDAMRVYEEKVAPEPPNDPGSPIMQMGLATEAHNASLYAARTGAKLMAPGMMWAANIPWAFATLDRVALFDANGGTPGETRPAELKYTLFFDDDAWGKDGSDHIPDGYLVQCTWQMVILRSRGYEASRADVSALSGSGEHRIYTVPFDQKLATMLLELGAAFWHFVAEKIQPLDWTHPLRSEIVNRLLEIRPDTSIALDDKAQLIADRYTALKATAKQANDEATGCKEALQAMLAGAELGTLPDGRRVKQQTLTRKSYTVAESSYVDFRILNAKKEKQRAQ